MMPSITTKRHKDIWKRSLFFPYAVMFVLLCCYIMSLYLDAHCKHNDITSFFYRYVYVASVLNVASVTCQFLHNPISTVISTTGFINQSGAIHRSRVQRSIVLIVLLRKAFKCVCFR